MRILKFRLIKLILLATSINLYAQVSFIPISADYAVFQMNDSLAYVEFYLSFFQNNLQYENKNDTLQASFENKLIVSHNGKEYKKIIHNFKNTIADSNQANKFGQFLDIFAIPLPFRNFSATMSVKDKSSGYTGEYLLNINIPGKSKEFNLSDIELASSIKQTTETGKFIKNSLNIIAYPRKTYDLLQPMLYYYVELNNLSFDKTVTNSYKVNYSVTNEKSDTLKTGPLKTKKIAANAQIEIGAFNALALAEGAYFLNIHATDISSGVSSNSRKRFYVRKPISRKKTVVSLPDIDPLFNELNKEELEKEFGAAKYYATSQEKDIFEQLEEETAMRSFLTSFWRNQDKLNNSLAGLSRDKFLKLLHLVESKYGSSMFKGYRSDKGRVTIIYGEPDEIERFTNTTNTIPYEIWTYHTLNGGSDFIFADRNGFGRYELIHSTYYKELQSPSWYNLIQKTPSR